MKRFIKRHGKGTMSAVGITAATIAVYLFAHDTATVQRGYEAIGGEIFIFLIPAFVVWFAPKAKELFKGAAKDVLD